MTGFAVGFFGGSGLPWVTLPSHRASSALSKIGERDMNVRDAHNAPEFKHAADMEGDLLKSFGWGIASSNPLPPLF